MAWWLRVYSSAKPSTITVLLGAPPPGRACSVTWLPAGRIWAGSIG